MTEPSLVRVTGVVVQGAGSAGAVFGTPTANFHLAASLPIRPGVYLSRVTFKGAAYGGVTCYGADGGEKFETHIFDFSGHLVGVELAVEIISWVSGLVPWESEGQMRAKIHSDVESARTTYMSHKE